jgi:hypothetical protein
MIKFWSSSSQHFGLRDEKQLRSIRQALDLLLFLLRGWKNPLEYLQAGTEVSYEL